MPGLFTSGESKLERQALIERFVTRNWSAVDHGGRSLADHCLGVGRLLQHAGAGSKLIHCGLMHPIFGAESYPGLEYEIQDRGEYLLEESERSLVRQYSEVSEESLYLAGLTRNAGFLASRRSGKPVSLDDRSRLEVCALLFANIAEQFLSCPDVAHIQEQKAELLEAVLGLGEIAGNVGTNIRMRLLCEGIQEAPEDVSSLQIQ